MFNISIRSTTPGSQTKYVFDIAFYCAFHIMMYHICRVGVTKEEAMSLSGGRSSGSWTSAWGDKM
jgi:hypothetical protein